MSNVILLAASVALPALAIVAARFVRRERVGTLVAILLCALGSGATALAIWLRPPAVPEDEVANRPIEVQTEGFVTSTSCRACHPREYATWNDSYHRKMTQRAAPGTVVGDFDGVELTRFGRTWQLSRRGDEYWIDMEDPMAPAGTRGARVQRKVTMTTGTHHMQLCWYETGHTRVMGLLPFAYLTPEKTWIPRQAAFVLPPSEEVLHEMGQWSIVCLKCHATNSRPRADMDLAGLHGADTQVSEFSIACESCHGPAAEHVRANQDPTRRYTLHATDARDPTIVNPAHLDHRRSTDVCGQCHGIFDLTLKGKPLQDFFAHGFTYRPGDDLAQTRPVQRKGMEEQFWPDGEPRVAGREFNGLVVTACFQRGEMSCLSCHVMHQHGDDRRPRSEWADDQLRTRDVEPTCLQCHPKVAADVTAHTHHAAGSTGSRCDNCHMPFSTYGLLKGVRNHHIASPDVATTLATGRPNACNLCHLDQTLAWTADNLQRWYGTAKPTLSSDDQTYAATANGVLKGDAAVRALLAFGLGWDVARAVSGQEWIPLYLAELIDDPYEVVRIIAGRSLRKLPGFEDIVADVVNHPEDRGRVKALILDRWRQAMPAPGDGRRETVLIAPDGSLRAEPFADLLGRRSARSVKLFE